MLRSSNLVPQGTDTSNGYVSEHYLNKNGVETESSNYNISEYFTVTANTIYEYYCINTVQNPTMPVLPSICFYTTDKVFISGVAFSGKGSVLAQAPSNAKYARVSLRIASMEMQCCLNIPAYIRAGNEQAIRITFPNKSMTEEDIYSNGITYTEVMNGDTDLTIGKAVCSSIYIPLVNDGTYTDFDFSQQFTVEIGINVNNMWRWQSLGKFIGEKPKRLMGDTIELVGYDLMSVFEKETTEKNAKDFLTSLTYPKTIGQIFDSLCTYYGITGDRTKAINADRQITDAPFNGNGITGRDILAWIAEACGCYARMSRTGKCELVWFSASYYSIDANDYYTIEPMEFEVSQIDQVRVQVTEKDIGTNYPTNGTFEHSYSIIDNPFLYANEASSLNTATTNLYSRLHAFATYTPCSVFADGNWQVQCGDIITVVDLDDNTQISLPVFNVTLNWYGRADCTYESTGSEYRESVTTVQKQVIRQNYKYHELEADIDSLRSMIVSSSFHIYVQQEDPVDTVGRSELVKGDFWVYNGLETWADVKWKNYQHTISRHWEEVWNENSGGYKWFQLFSKTQCWDGEKWILVSDPITIAEQSSRIEQTAEAIELEVKRANGAEGQLASSLSMTADQITLEVQRATIAEEQLNSKITITESEISTEVTRAQGAEGVLSSRITETADAISVEVTRAQGAEGRLSSRIDVTDSAISTEVTRAQGAEGTLQSNIDQTAEDIRLGVKSAGKVLTSGSYILIETNKITLDSGGDINIKSGATFTVASNNFKIDSSGNVTMTGEVTANTGKIGGWYIGSDYLGNKSTKANSTVGLHALTTEETASDTYVIWAGNKTQSNADFSVKGDGTVSIKKGSLNIGSGDFVVDSTGNVTIKKGSIKIGSNFEVSSTGVITAKSGTIAGWTIGTKSFYNGTDSMTSTTEGAYLGTDGIRIYKDATHIFYVPASSGQFIFKGGMTGIDDTTNTTGTYIGYNGIALGGGKFKVTNEGYLTAQSGTVGGWYIGQTYLGNADTRDGSSIGFRSNATGSNTAFWLGGTLDRPTTWTAVYNNGANKWSNYYDGITWEDLLPPPFRVTANGRVYAKYGNIGGWTISRHALTASKVGFSSSGDIAIWAGASSASSATFTVSQNGDVVIKQGSINLGDNFVVTSTGYVTIKDGSIVITEGSIKLGSKFEVTSTGTMTAVGATLETVTAKSGYIGDGSSGWTIGKTAIYNGCISLTSTGNGTYVGVDGIRVYKDAQNSFTVEKSNGRITVKGGMEAISDTAHSTGMYIGYDGIALGGGKFKVTDAGVLTAKSGVIGGWNIGTTSIYNGTNSLSSTTEGVYVGTDGIYIFKDASHNVKIAKSTGAITVMGGKKGINLASADQTTGVYIGSDGIAFGRSSDTSSGSTVYSDAFSVTSSGTLTAKSGKIGNWSIGSKSLYNGTSSLTSTTAGVYLGTDGLYVYKGSTASVKIQQSTGYLTVIGGKTGIGVVPATNGIYIGSDGIALGRKAFTEVDAQGQSVTVYRDAFSVTDAGALKSYSGIIGGWNIGIKSIYNGTNSLSSTTAGVFMSITGTRWYADETHNFTINASSGNFAFRCGMTGVSDTEHTSGAYVGYNGIALGGGKFKVTSAGVLTAKDGTIAGWKIDEGSLSKTDMSGSTVVSNVGMSSSGDIAFYAGTSSDPASCLFNVKKDGRVYLQKLYTRYLDKNDPRYNPDDSSTWAQCIVDAEVNLQNNGYKIGDNYKTIRSVSNGTVRLSDGSSFDTATSAYLTASWSSGVAPVTGNSYGTAVLKIASPSNSQISATNLYIAEDVDNKQIDVSSTLFGTGDSAHKYMPITATYNKGVDYGKSTVKIASATWGGETEGGVYYNTITLKTTGASDTKTILLNEDVAHRYIHVSCGALSLSGNVSASNIYSSGYNNGYDAVGSTAEWSNNNTGDYTGDTNTLNVTIPNKTDGSSRSRMFSFSTTVDGNTVKIMQGGHTRFQKTISTSNTWSYSSSASTSTTEPKNHTWTKTYSFSSGYSWAYFYVTVNGETRWFRIHVTS